MLVLGIDQSYTSTGYCYLDTKDDIILDCGIISTKPDKDIYYRAHRISQELKRSCQLMEPHLIGIEGLAYCATGNATRDLGGLHFAIVLQLRYNIRYEDRLTVVAPNTLKKFATGHGHADKPKMFEHVPEHHKERILEGKFTKKQREDIVDSFWLAKFVQQ